MKDVQKTVDDAGIATGLCTVFVQHTSASLVIQENAREIGPVTVPPREACATE